MTKYLEKQVAELKRAMIRRDYAATTIDIYSRMLEQFLQGKVSKPMSKLTQRDVVEYIDRQSSCHLARQLKYALKFYYVHVRKLKFPKITIEKSGIRPRDINILAPSVIKEWIKGVKNSKHKLIIEFLYVTGIRNCELRRLKVGDINWETTSNADHTIYNGKGGKNRFFYISPRLLSKLKEQVISENQSPQDFLFQTRQSKRSKSPMASSTLRWIMKNANSSQDVNMWPHLLRHHCSAHLRESGYSLETRARVLGHQSSHTTARHYDHGVKNIHLPGDFEHPLETEILLGVKRKATHQTDSIELAKRLDSMERLQLKMMKMLKDLKKT